MGKIMIDGADDLKFVNIPARFIDEYMPLANGEFVKVYLYLLRTLSYPDIDISICGIADKLNHTEKDIVRALKYWEQNNLIKLIVDDERNLLGIKLLSFPKKETENVNIDTNNKVSIKLEPTVNIQPEVKADSKIDIAANNTFNVVSTVSNYEEVHSQTPERRTYSANEIHEFKSRSDVTEFLYMAHKYIGKSLSSPDTNILLYIYDELKFDAELIEYLIEYCVTNNHKSVRYMEKVALSWYEEGIDTTEKAKASTSLYSKSCYPVLKAFGISGRNPGAGEKALIVKWTNNYGFDMDIILDACNRTMNTIHQPSFEYADSILTKWKEKGVRSLSEIKALDEEYSNKKATRQISNKENKTNNSFNNFSQRSYNYESLEKNLLGNM